MVKTNLPVILLKGLVILPYQEVRIEVNNEISKKVIDISKLYHDDEVLIVCPIDFLEENPDTSDLPKIGVIGKIKSKIELQNGNARIVISGEKRVKVYSYVNYSNEEDVLESIVAPIKYEEVDEIEETAVLRKLISELDKYISSNPFISNSIISQITGITELDKLTDMIANFLPLSFEKKISLMLDASPTSRAKYLIKEINIESAILELENKIEINLKNDLDESQKEFILREKIKIIKQELGEENTKDKDIQEFKNKINNITLPNSVLEKINREIRRYEITPDASPEVSVIRNYIDNLLLLPWNKESKDEKNLNKIEKSLDSTHFGLDQVKIRIVEYIAVKNISSNVLTPVICLSGPPGVGKTTFAESIASSLNREFVKISLGGMYDTAELVGHRRTYIGSNPGKIINALIKAKTKNPVILLDEIDKLSRDFRGDPASTLLDILDQVQNKKFIDNYIEEEFDLSKVFFIVTANDKFNIPPALYDRLEIIDINGYTLFEKLDISKRYLITKALKNNGIKPKTIYFEDEAIIKVIEGYTKESGVRELDRVINKIIRKVITQYSKENKELNNIKITKEDLKKYLNTEKYRIDEVKNNGTVGVVTGLAYTTYGGETIEVEVESYDSDGKEIVTGTLGDVMKESITIALSYIKSHYKELGIKKESFTKKTFHINVRKGGIPKDGPSAGVTITTALISHLLNKKVKANISMTGEITLTGDVLPIGGLKEKSLAALRNGIKTIFLPFDNKKDLEELDKNIKEKIDFRVVKNYKEIYNYIFK